MQQPPDILIDLIWRPDEEDPPEGEGQGEGQEGQGEGQGGEGGQPSQSPQSGNAEGKGAGEGAPPSSAGQSGDGAGSGAPQASPRPAPTPTPQELADILTGVLAEKPKDEDGGKEEGEPVKVDEGSTIGKGEVKGPVFAFDKVLNAAIPTEHRKTYDFSQVLDLSGGGAGNYDSFGLKHADVKEWRLAATVSSLFAMISEQKSGLPIPGRDFWDMHKLMNRPFSKKSLNSCKNSREKEFIILLVDTSPSCKPNANLYARIASHAVSLGVVEAYSCPNGLIAAKWNPANQRWDGKAASHVRVRQEEMQMWPWENRTIVYFSDYDGLSTMVKSMAHNDVWFFCNEMFCSKSNHSYGYGQLDSEYSDVAFINREAKGYLYMNRHGTIIKEWNKIPVDRIREWVATHRVEKEDYARPGHISDTRLVYCANEETFIRGVARIGKTN